jgi:hypothetical protein
LCIYQIIKHPKFGALKLIDGERAQDKISYFNNHQIEKKLVSYVHNSEGSPTKDFFKVN